MNKLLSDDQGPAIQKDGFPFPVRILMTARPKIIGGGFSRSCMRSKPSELGSSSL